MRPDIYIYFGPKSRFPRIVFCERLVPRRYEVRPGEHMVYNTFDGACDFQMIICCRPLHTASVYRYPPACGFEYEYRTLPVGVPGTVSHYKARLSTQQNERAVLNN